MLFGHLPWEAALRLFCSGGGFPKFCIPVGSICFGCGPITSRFTRRIGLQTRLTLTSPPKTPNNHASGKSSYMITGKNCANLHHKNQVVNRYARSFIIQSRTRCIRKCTETPSRAIPVPVVPCFAARDCAAFPSFW